MNLITSIFLAAILSISTAFAQKKDATFNFRSIDSVKIFAPIGNISSSDDYSIKPNEMYTDEYLSKFKNALTKEKSFQTTIVENSELQNLENQKYFAKLMRRLGKINDESFTKIAIGEKLKNVIAAENGRFFSFIFFSGFDNTKHDPTIVSSTEKLIVLADNKVALSYPMATEQPYLKNYTIIIDKKTNKIIYFNLITSQGEPTKEENIQKQVDQLYTDLK